MRTTAPPAWVGTAMIYSMAYTRTGWPICRVQTHTAASAARRPHNGATVPRHLGPAGARFVAQAPVSGRLRPGWRETDLGAQVGAEGAS